MAGPNTVYNASEYIKGLPFNATLDPIFGEVRLEYNGWCQAVRRDVWEEALCYTSQMDMLVENFMRQYNEAMRKRNRSISNNLSMYGVTAAPPQMAQDTKNVVAKQAMQAITPKQPDNKKLLLLCDP